MLNFDDNRTWGLLLTDAVGGLLSESILNRLVAAAPEYVKDARDLLFDWTDRDRVIDATLTWIRSTTLAGYHETRLIDSEVDSIRAHGLLPLEADARRARPCLPRRGPLTPSAMERTRGSVAMARPGSGRNSFKWRGVGCGISPTARFQNGLNSVPLERVDGSVG